MPRSPITPRRLLEGISDIFGHADDSGAETGRPSPPARDAAASDFSGTAKSLEHLLTGLRRQTEARREKEQRQRAMAHGRVAGMSEDDAREVKTRRTAEIHAQIRADVIAMHESLGDGVDGPVLDELAAFFDELIGVMESPQALGVEAYIRASVVRRLFDESGPLAWSRLIESMERAEIDWPALDPRHREHSLAMDREMFLASSARTVGDLLTGIVRVWADHYPARGSVLWRDVCLRACGAGIRVRMIHSAVAHLQDHGDELRAEGKRILAEEIEVVKSAVGAGITSVDDAERVFSGATGALERVIPDLCWERVRTVMGGNA